MRLFQKRLYQPNEGGKKFLAELDQISKQRQKNSNKPMSTSSEAHRVRCAYCNSTNVKKITATGRMVSVATLGLAGNKIGKEWHCNNCGSNF